MWDSIFRAVAAAMFVFAGAIHFYPKWAKRGAAMIPPYILRVSPLSASQLFAFTGICEIAGGVGLMIPSWQSCAGYMLAVFLVCVLPANIYAAQNPERFKKLAIPLSRRVPAQVVLILWVLWVGPWTATA